MWCWWRADRLILDLLSDSHHCLPDSGGWFSFAFFSLNTGVIDPLHNISFKHTIMIKAFVLFPHFQSNHWRSLEKEVKFIASVMSNSATPRTVARQPPLSMGFSRQEYCSGDLPNRGMEPVSLQLQHSQADSLLLSHTEAQPSLMTQNKSNAIFNIRNSNGSSVLPYFSLLSTSHNILLLNIL